MTKLKHGDGEIINVILVFFSLYVNIGHQHIHISNTISIIYL